MFIAVPLVLILFIALAWLRYGFWSAFLHMMCVIVAGALALAVWEPLSLVLLNAGQEWLSDMAWAVGLVMPFIVILLVIRVACDKIIPSNLHFSSTTNIVGGLACGTVSAVIAAGILTIGAGYLRVPAEFLGYSPVKFNNNGGSLIRGDSLLAPVDRITAGFYAALSEGSYRPVSGETLARWRPDPVSFGGLLRTTFQDAGKHTVLPGVVKVMRRYQFTSDGKPDELLTDGIDPLDPGARTRKHAFTHFDGSTPDLGNSLIEGFVVNFDSGAKEASGRIVVGAAQVQLLVQPNPADESTTMAIQPVAVISQASGDRPNLGRWRFDAAGTFIASSSAQASAVMGFEFLVPKGARPLALYVKGLRFDVSGMEAGAKFASQSERDAAVRNRSILTGGGTVARNLVRQGSVVFRTNNQDQGEPIIGLNNRMPFNVTLQKDIMKGLIASDANRLTGGGLAKFSRDDLKGTQGMDPKLVVRQIEEPDDASLVHVIVDRRNATWGFLSDAAAPADRSKPPQLVDTNGVTYQAVGYGYRLAGETWIYYDPSAPLQSMNDQEMPTLSRSQPDQELVLIFRVSRGVKVQAFAIGDRVIADFTPQLDVPRR
jgi:hypothetical protein